MEAEVKTAKKNKTGVLEGKKEKRKREAQRRKTTCPAAFYASFFLREIPRQ